MPVAARSAGIVALVVWGFAVLCSAAAVLSGERIHLAGLLTLCGCGPIGAALVVGPRRARVAYALLAGGLALELLALALWMESWR